ncbi:hypothetical protein [Desulfatitalea alkaliphila]|uniref:Uncharacterized protein n=1 Tax=Desulfatitalea alkaliphila TaxID=2929485 RepID=A0AA41R9S5_9BACT|nr:hypothetical protein [Desulfatitalea alkaliphila]MCJ8501293.1 hypothetical protein [Desulfatitalea alkaliphila]
MIITIRMLMAANPMATSVLRVKNANSPPGDDFSAISMNNLAWLAMIRDDTPVFAFSMPDFRASQFFDFPLQGELQRLEMQ